MGLPVRHSLMRVSALILAVLLFSTTAVPAAFALSSDPLSRAFPAATSALSSDEAATSEEATTSGEIAATEASITADLADPLPRDNKEVVETRIVAWPKDSTTPAKVEALVSGISTELDIVDDTDLLNNPQEKDREALVVVESEAQHTEDLMTEMADSGLFKSVDYDVLIDPQVYTSNPNDPFFDVDPAFIDSWGLNVFPGGNFSAAWARLDLARGNPDTAPIALIDTGFYMGVEDQGSNIVAGYDFGSARASVVPQSTDALARHGTATAGVIGAHTNNGLGIAGAAWDNKVIIYKAADAQNNLYLSAVTNSINDVVAKRNARIINLSLGGTVFPDYLKQAIDNAIAADILVVASAGNTADSGNATLWPAAYGPVLSVAATGPDGQWADFSTYNSSVDIAAPGEHIAVMDYNNTYDFTSGTSFSAPYVCAAAALVWRAAPALDATHVQNILKVTAHPVGTKGNQKTGAGVVDTDKAFEAALLKPFQPKNIKVTPQNGKIKVAWSRANLCPLPIVGYTLEWREKGASTWKIINIDTTSSTYSHTVGGLKDNRDYQFRIATRNINGTGPYSSTYTSKTYPLKMLTSKSTVTMKRGTTVIIHVAPHYKVKTSTKVSWKSSKPKVASISTTGLAAKKKGAGTWKANTIISTNVASAGKKIKINGLKKGTSYITFTTSYAKKKVKVVVR